MTTDIPAEGHPDSRPPAWESYAQTLSRRLQDVSDTPLPEAEQARLRAKLIQFEQQAQDFLAPHRGLLVRLSEALLLKRDMTPEELMPWLGQLSARD